VTFLFHIDDVGDGECDKSGRRQRAKRATARAAMVMARMVVGNEEGGGNSGKSDGDGDGDEGGGQATATREKATSMRGVVTVTGVVCDKEARVRVMPKGMRVVGDKEDESSKAARQRQQRQE
jgi:hypothetical protein